MPKQKSKNEINWLHVAITAIVIIWFAMIVAARVYQNRGSSPPLYPAQNKVFEEEEKRQLLEALVKQETSKLSKKQKEKMVESVAKGGSNNLTVEEKKYLLEQLTK